ncbi:MAG: hypothetical protein ACRDBH_02295 [Bosea sp. (in: a-proteobacteria)]
MTSARAQRILELAEKRGNSIAIVLAHELIRMLEQRQRIMRALTEGRATGEMVASEVIKEMIDDEVRDYVHAEQAAV